METQTPPTATEEHAQAESTGPSFESLGLGPDALRAIAELGYDEPTAIQERTIPLLLSGEDVVAQAPTGTGKTAAYGLPIVERLDENELSPQALIIVPTRELAIQVSDALHGLGKYRDVVTLPIYGGQPYDRQFRALKSGVQVVTGTPGRLLDHISRGTLNLSGTRYVVLDEADEMLNMGFIEDIEAILSELPDERQTALFSATIPPRISRLAEVYLRTPRRVNIAAREAVAPLVRQVYYEVPAHLKPEVLANILDLEEPESAIVFVRTRRDADTVAEALNDQGYVASAIHGDLSQAQRERVLNRFRGGHVQLLVATDVAARGLDIPDVSHIINYDLPLDPEWYVHRIGRTGRAGRTGQALTLVTPRERRHLRIIEQVIHRRLQRMRLPTPTDVAARRREAFREEVLQILDAGQLDPYLALVEDLVDTREPAEVAAAAFKMAAQARETTRPGARAAGGRSATRLGRRSTSVASPAVAAPSSDMVTEPEGADRRDEPAHDPFRRPERPDRVELPDRPSAEGGPFRPHRERRGGGMARLFLRVGHRDGVRPADLVGAIANEAGVPGSDIDNIDIYDQFAFVEVPEETADTVLAALNRTTIRGREVQASIARPSDDSEPRDSSRTGPRDGRRSDRRPSYSPNRAAGRDFRPDRGPRSPRPFTPSRRPRPDRPPGGPRRPFRDDR